MSTIDKLHLPYEWQFNDAENLANELNADNDDNWRYAVILLDNGNGVIAVYDENDEYLGEL